MGFICVYVCVCVCVCVHAHAHACVRVCACVRACMHVNWIELPEVGLRGRYVLAEVVMHFFIQ
jgi:hypothetical protein